ncbi:ATP-binding protein [Pseudarthrobacter quantipunctorum]|uniref:histidine kinase n=1 Tax=Pseudarthrobacter quantipunctorum TaxID=3128980 RepID=A0ABZ2R138_9MICC
MTEQTSSAGPVDAPFRPRARILQLLGDQLIGSPRLAVLELVKNAYDADASSVQIVLNNVHQSEGSSITVTDDGDGMTLETLRDIWLTPGHDHRANQRNEGRRSKQGRLPLGEKGLGRFAVHKLGDQISMVTRAADEDECYLTINWTALSGQEYLDEARVQVFTREPQVFIGDKTGTQIHITALRGSAWDRRQVRWLQRQVLSICSPFERKNDDFRAFVEFPQHRQWLEQIQDPEAILRLAPWKFEFTVDTLGSFDWTYTYNGVAGIDSHPRTENSEGDILFALDDHGEWPVDAASLMGIGPLKGVFYTFDRDASILKRLGQTTLLRQYLNENGGIRIYRDGIRVYNYGEPGDDWLGLDVRRINTPSERISNNIVIGLLEIDLASSTDLHEKTNREGFIENIAYKKLQDILLAVIARFEVERNIDKRALRIATAKKKNINSNDIAEPLAEIRSIAGKHGILREVEPLIEATLERFTRFKTTMLRSNLSGMALVVVFHELEHSIRLLIKSSEGGATASSIAEQARTIARVLDGFADIVRKGEVKNNSIKGLIRRVVTLNQVRLTHHEVEVIAPFLSAEQDAERSFSFGLLLGALNNIFDNSLFWLNNTYRDGRKKRIFIDYDEDFIEGPAILIVDNGPGFKDAPEELTEPFFTRRPNGMGVGLYYVSLAMELHGGRLAFPTLDQIKRPSEDFNGAAVALVLDGKK